MVDLQRGVFEPELIVQEGFKRAADGVAITGLVDQDVRREGRKVGGDLPDVQVVDLENARSACYGLADRIWACVSGRGLQEDTC